MTNKCKRCGENLQPGVYIAQTFTGGTPDFPGDTHPTTFSAGGPGVLSTCLKCPECGWSVTLGGRVLGDNYREPKYPGWWIETRPLWLRLMLYLLCAVLIFGGVALVAISLASILTVIVMEFMQ